ncbi:MAG: LamG domain-containing protein, partial [Nanoarchaeota archaeon]|nr:LamG domain-containing protein [Nanoarchaeota archaeon]
MVLSNTRLWAFQSGVASDELKVFIANAVNDAGVNHGETTDTNLAVGQWYHVVFVYNGAGATNADKLKIYVNGVLKTITFTGTIPTTLTSSTSDMMIGRFTGTLTRYWNGAIDDVAIFNRSLSADEVLQIYKNTNKQTTLSINNSYISGGDLTNVIGDFKIKTYLKGNGTSTAVINDIIGYYETASVSDTTVPTFRQNTTTQSYPIMYEPNLNNSFGINCTDDIGIYNVLFESNYTRTPTNYTPVNSTIDIFNYSFIDYGVMNFTSRWICNDTGGNENLTDSLTFAVVQNNSLNAIQYFNPSPATYSSDYIIYDNFTIRDIRGDIPAFYNYINDSLYDNSSGLVGYWKMDYNGDLYDHSGNSNDGTVIGATYTSSGKFGGAYDFDGTNADYISVPDSSSLKGMSELTISLWAYKDISGIGHILIEKNGTGADYQIYSHTDNKIRFAINADWANAGWSSQALDSGKWYHIVGVYDGTNVRVYVNNIVGTSVAKTGTVGISAATVRIGCRESDCLYKFNGTIDEPKIFNRALSATEITRLYNSGKGNRFLAAGTYNITTNTTGNTNYSSTSDSDLFTVNKDIPVLIMNNDTSNVNNSDMKGYWNLNGNTLDSSGNDNDGTIVNGTTSTSLGKYGSAYSFDAVNDQINVSDSVTLDIGTSDFSISVWFNSADVTSNVPLVAKRPVGGAGAVNGFITYVLATGDVPYLQIDNSDGDYATLSGTKDVVDGTWRYLTFVFDRDGSGYIYVDGVLDKSGTIATTGNSLANMQDLWIRRGCGSTNCNVYGSANTIDDVAIFSRSLSSDEIKQLYETTITYHPNNASSFSYSESNEGDSDLTFNFYRNTTAVTSPDSDINAGYYYYTVNTSGGENYTKSSLLTPLSILKNNTVQSYMNLTIGEGTGGTEANYSQTYYPNANYNATGNYTSSVFNGQVITFTLYWNTTSIGITNPVNSSFNDFGASYRYFNYSTDGNINYSSTFKYYNLTIIQNNSLSSLFNLTLDSVELNKTGMYPYALTATGINSTPENELTFTLYRNDSDVGALTETQTWGAGQIYYTFNSSGNTNYSAASKHYHANITQNITNPVNLDLNGTVNGNKTYTYPESIKAIAEIVYLDSGTVLLWRDDVSVSNPEEIRLGNETYAYKVNTSGNTNYTNNETGATYYALVLKGGTSIDIYLNGTQNNNATITYPSESNTTALCNLSSLYSQIYRNNALQANSTGTIYNVTRLANNTYNFTAVCEGNENYTSDSKEYYLTVLKATPSIYLALNDTQSNYTYVYENYINATGWKSTQNDEGVLTLYRNFTNITAGQTPFEIIILGNDSHNYTISYPSTENYTSNSISYYALVNKKTPIITLTTNSWTRTYPDTGMVNCSISTLYNEAPANLYRNDSDINVTENYIAYRLGYYTHNYTCNNTATANYSSNSTSNILTINKGTLLTYLSLNGTQGDKIYNDTDYANLTAWSNATIDTVLTTIYMNVSGTFENITAESIIAENITNLSAFTFANYNITANTTGNENYSSSDGTTYMLSMNDTSSPTINTFSLSASS